MMVFVNKYWWETGLQCNGKWWWYIEMEWKWDFNNTIYGLEIMEWRDRDMCNVEKQYLNTVLSYS